MERKFRLILVIGLLVSLLGIADAQPLPGQGGPGGGENAEMHPGGPGGPGPGMMPGKFKPDPEREKQMKRNASMMAMAEAHKNLAKIYETQGKTDEAAAELIKIIDLAKGQLEKNKDNEFFKRNIMSKVMPVYHHISKLYIKNNRLADAEKILNEGIALFEKESPEDVTRLRLLLAE
ncbi:MAG: tetratricopeptide repeat protein, partial [Candidatus Riflebacteria bacterium]|nr:tetratricopeptide repeat protein [Candidatus Riflebacteria bacterium]